MTPPGDTLTVNAAGINAGRLLIGMLDSARRARETHDADARRQAQDTARALTDRIAADPTLAIRADIDGGRATVTRWEPDRSYPAGAYCHHEGNLYRAQVTTRGNHPERTGAWVTIQDVLQRGDDATPAPDPTPAPESTRWWARLRHWCSGGGRG